VIAELVVQSIPSPSEGVWHLGPVPLRAYALAIILGVFAAIWLGERRWAERGGTAGQVGDIAIWGVPAGLVGARVYHVITDHSLYFGDSDKVGEHWNPLGALQVWNGGLGIWGAIAGGVLGGLFACRFYGIKFRPMLDALAPALLLAQVIGRFGNYFNQELFGRPTTLPWGLEISDKNAPPTETSSETLYHPTFLYEALWNGIAIGLLIWLDRKFKLGYGRVFALYVMFYCAGRGWIENLRIDAVEYSDVFGLRLNVWTSILLFLAALVYFVLAGRRHPRPNSREESVYIAAPEPAEGAESADAADGAEGSAEGEKGSTPV